METLDLKIRNKSGSDVGYLPRDKPNWWFDISFPHSFEFFNLDSFYEDVYFKDDHVNEQVTRLYVDSVLHYGKLFHNSPVTSVFEAGCGGGWFTKEFLSRGI